MCFPATAVKIRALQGEFPGEILQRPRSGLAELPEMSLMHGKSFFQIRHPRTSASSETIRPTIDGLVHGTDMQCMF